MATNLDWFKNFKADISTMAEKGGYLKVRAIGGKMVLKIDRNDQMEKIF